MAWEIVAGEGRQAWNHAANDECVFLNAAGSAADFRLNILGHVFFNTQ